MLNIFKHHKLILGCSAIATATITGFVSSAEAAGQLNNQVSQPISSTTFLIANNDSNGTGSNTTGTNNGSNNTGNGSNNTGPKVAPGIIITDGSFGPYYFDSNNGGTAPSGPGPFYYDPNGPKGPGYYPYQGNGQAYFYGNGPKGLGYYSYNVNAIGPIGQNGSGNSGAGTPTARGTIGIPPGSSGLRSSSFGPNTVALASSILPRFNAAMSKYGSAAATLAAAEAAQTNASSGKEPVRFARQVADASACGCPNTDTNPTAGTPSKELVAARAAEAEAAAELAAAKAEARQLLESIKDGRGSNGSSSFQPIW